ncbi:MAG: hypothetical protein ACRYGI_04040 [Janthinobacterium lividum]
MQRKAALLLWVNLLRIVQCVGILIAVGMLVEFLPIDLAIVLVIATATQVWLWLRVIRQYFMLAVMKK